MQKHINLALSMAKKSTSKFRLGAVLARRGNVISTGYNQMDKTHPLQNKFYKGDGALGLHAEVHACIGVPAADLLGAHLYVTRILANGQIAMAKPCPTCYKFLTSVGVARVTFSVSGGPPEEIIL
jgi:deoxycytidylate deaminase